MSAYFTVILTIAFAMTVNARYDRATYLQQLNIPKNINPDDIYNEIKYADSFGRYIEPYPYPEKASEPAVPRYIENAIKSSEIKTNDDDFKSAEAPPEPLPVPMASHSEFKAPAYKKSGTNYYMTLCHFKICNMGRKRDTRYLHLKGLMEKLHEQANNAGSHPLMAM